MEVPAFSFQSRWRRPGIQRENPAKLYDKDAVEVEKRACPGRSAQNR